MAKVISFQELAKHKCRNNCWILIHGKVYDVSSFMDEHPGGDNLLLSVTGKDASDDFDDVSHSEEAKGMMKRFYIGDVDRQTVPATKKYVPPWKESKTAQSTATVNAASAKASGSHKMFQFLVPLLILGAALVFRFYTK
ncbi:PREDICTED: cytochrome B5-like [Tarenaya hassleriana]|uniref:cytochrome B5-like n=1 Tax=Tarenaya hassleriana TaxID=28532 RepID=UPI00053C9CC1|nr:PREDICTED: cytochrome B5-like [Tarenaya hassleriana]XP_010523829.1 PREDICTED: cytochrome B5-like [Tarenaya hassleriana]